MSTLNRFREAKRKAIEGAMIEGFRRFDRAVKEGKQTGRPEALRVRCILVALSAASFEIRRKAGSR